VTKAPISRSLAYAPVHQQIEGLELALQENDVAQAAMMAVREIALPDGYLGAGGVTQTVWNLLHHFEPGGGIKDYDLVYFDASDLTVETEKQIEADVAGRLAGLPVVVDVKNQARVHLWYEGRFGRTLEPFHSTGEAIATWPTTASSVGVRYDDKTFVVCAPFGLSDLFAMIVRPNKAIVTREVFEEKAIRWASRWPELTVLPW
jgi:hypothetical protein